MTQTQYIQAARPAQAPNLKPYSLLGHCIEICRKNPANLIFPDGEDLRAISAAMRIQREQLGSVLLLGRPFRIRELARGEAQGGANPAQPLLVLDHLAPDLLEHNVKEYMSILRAGGKSADEAEAKKFMSLPSAAGAMLVRQGAAETGVGGNISSTSDMLRAGLRIIGTAPGSRTISSFFFMLAPENSTDSRKVLVFADSGVIPEPSEEQLVDIAVDSAGQFKRMTGQEPRVALLSFSSHGSASHPRAEQMRRIASLVRQKEPGLIIDGELQFDAAMIPEVALRKVPDSPLRGEANVLIFPNLEAGNIGYKIAQRLGGYTALGPLLQGLNGGWHDLSRGCSAEDIYQVALLGTALCRSGK